MRTVSRLAGTLLLVAFYAALPLGAQPTRVYLAPDDHTDYVWTADEAVYRKAFLDTLDYYLALIDSTASEPPEHQARWNCDGHLWIWEYEKNKSLTSFQRLMSRVKDGHVGVPLNALAVCLGAAPAEAVIRGMYYPGRLERTYGVSFPMAYCIENATMPYGVASLWAGAGAKYSWNGICRCATKLPGAGNREDDIYWWVGPDGSRILMKWYSMIGTNNQRLGGYAELWNPATAVADCVAKAGSAKYPYDAVAAFGQGWDNLMTLTDSVVKVAKASTTSTLKVIVSNEADFFQDFETNHGAKIPSRSVSYGNEWDLLCASLAEVSAQVKRALEKLRAAEAMATLVALDDPTFMNGRTSSRELAWMNFGLYWEHVWHGDGNVPRAVREAFQRRLANEIRAYVNRLHQDAIDGLGKRIVKSGTDPRFFVFNPLSWPRDDVVDLPYVPQTPVHVIDLAAGKEVPSQTVTAGGTTYLRILASGVPSLGYRVYEVRSGAPAAFPGGPTATGSVIESARYKVTLGANGAIQSWIDKTRSNREFVKNLGGFHVNDLGTGTGTIQAENVGPVSATLVATAAGPLKHTTRITLDRLDRRVAVDNEIEQNFGNVRKWAFCFNLTDPVVHHEEVGAILRADLSGNGGHYATLNCRYDWLTLNHFADMSGTEGGITLSNADCYFVQLGNSTVSSLDRGTPRLNVLAGGQVDSVAYGIQNQGLDSYFLQRFALQTRDTYDAAGAMRFALEHQNPLVAGPVTGGTSYPEKAFSLLGIDDPDVLAWAVKPADDGIDQGVILRVWNLGTSPSTFTVTPGGGFIASASEATHIETPTGAASVSGGALAGTAQQQQMRTYLAKLTQVTGAPVVLTSDTARPGAAVKLVLRAPRSGGLLYQAACSLGTVPGIPIGTRKVPLNLDGLFMASLTTPPVFANFSAGLDELGTGGATIRLPAISQLAGLTFYTAFLTLKPQAPFGVFEISDALTLKIHP